MNAMALLDELRALGIHLEPRANGNLRAVPKERLTDELIERIRQHKTELLAYLRAEQEERRIDRLAQTDGWKPLPPAGAPAYSILETARCRGIALSLDQDGGLRIGKADGSGHEPALWPSLIDAIEAHLEAVAALVAAGWHLRSDPVSHLSAA